MAFEFGSRVTIDGRSIADGVGRGFGEAVSGHSRGESAVNFASFLAGVTPLRVMEKRS